MKPNIIRATVLLPLACALLAPLAQAQSESGFYRPLTLVPADATSSGGGTGDDKRTKAAELAKTLQNPIASLISLRIQNNFDFGAGPTGDGFQYKVNVQPVVPISLSEDWSLISRTILAIVYQENSLGASSQSGLADTLESLLLSCSRNESESRFSNHLNKEAHYEK